MRSFDWIEQSKEEWNNHASFWNSRSKDMWENGSRKDILPFLLNHLEGKSKMLDVGCGDGYASYKLHTMGHDVIGVDISEEMIEKARERMKDIPFLIANIESLPIDSNSMDAALSINVLEWVENPATALTELRRVLKPNGFLIAGILGPTAGPRTAAFPKVYGKDTISNSMMPWEFHKLSNELGFSLIDEFGVYKKEVKKQHYEGLPVMLRQALSFMWVFLLCKREV